MDSLSPPDNPPTSTGLAYCGLPVEIIEIIMALLPKSSLTSVSRVSRSLHEMSAPLLYRDINLQSSAALVSCYKSLEMRPKARQMAQSLTISFGVSAVENEILQPRPLFASFHWLFTTGTRSLTNVTSLTIDISMPQLVMDTLKVCDFPFLATFATTMRLYPSHVAFFNRHPTIVRLICASDQTASRVLPDIKLPNLKALACFASQIRIYVFRNSPLQNLILTWKYPKPPIAPTLTAVKAGVARFLHLKHLTCCRSGSNLDLLKSFSTLQLPHLQRFEAQCLWDINDHEGFKEIVARELIDLRDSGSFLESFPSLQEMGYTYRDIVDRGTILTLPSRLPEDLKIAAAWGSQHPSLVRCLIISGIPISRVSPNEPWLS